MLLKELRNIASFSIRCLNLTEQQWEEYRALLLENNEKMLAVYKKDVIDEKNLLSSRISLKQNGSVLKNFSNFYTKLVKFQKMS